MVLICDLVLKTSKAFLVIDAYLKILGNCSEKPTLSPSNSEILFDAFEIGLIN